MTAPSTRQPVPQGDYMPAQRHGDLIHTSGMTPRRGGVLLFHGPVGRNAVHEDFRDAVRLACENALTAAQGLLVGDEQVAGILSMIVLIATEPGFEAHSKLADYASGFLREQLGPQAIGARTALGVATLPGNAPVEIQLVAFV